MPELISILEREILLREDGYAFPRSLWEACKEAAGEPDGGKGTTERYRYALRAIAEASGKNEIGQEHLTEALRIAGEQKNK